MCLCLCLWLWLCLWLCLCRLELYEKYKSFTLEGLKDFMRWNKQIIAGTKVSIRGKEMTPCIVLCPYLLISRTRL